MTGKKTKIQRLVIAAIAVVLVSVVVGAMYISRTNHSEREAEAMLQMEAGIEQFHQKQYELSLETLEGIPEDDLQHWRIRYYKGSALINLKDFPAAAFELEKALELKADEPHVLFALGVAYYRLNNPSMSKAYFAKVLEIDPGNQDARGLMDIMATIERQIEDGTIPGPEAVEKPIDNESGRGH